MSKDPFENYPYVSEGAFKRDRETEVYAERTAELVSQVSLMDAPALRRAIIAFIDESDTHVVDHLRSRVISARQ